MYLPLCEFCIPSPLLNCVYNTGCTGGADKGEETIESERERETEVGAGAAGATAPATAATSATTPGGTLRLLGLAM